jgi:hypothetical protein
MIVGSDDFDAGSIQSDVDEYRPAGHTADLIVVDGLGHAWSPTINAPAWNFQKRHQLPR